MYHRLADYAVLNAATIKSQQLHFLTSRKRISVADLRVKNGLRSHGVPGENCFTWNSFLLEGVPRLLHGRCPGL